MKRSEYIGEAGSPLVTKRTRTLTAVAASASAAVAVAVVIKKKMWSRK